MWMLDILGERQVKDSMTIQNRGEKMGFNHILFEVEEGVAIITINRPKVLNALNSEVLCELREAINKVSEDENIRCAIITGAGEKAFVAGADIAQMRDFNPLQAKSFAKLGQDVMFEIENCPKVVIACVNGYALGGGLELAMACDFIYASENAKLGQPEINLAVTPGFGGTQRLSRLVGKAKAKELCLTGNMIDAKEAQSIGLVCKVFPPDKLLEETKKIAKLIASKGLVALREIKYAINHGVDLDLVSGCVIERDAFSACFASPDQKEGMSAFLEKRKAEFRGKLE